MHDAQPGSLEWNDFLDMNCNGVSALDLDMDLIL